MSRLSAFCSWFSSSARPTLLYRARLARRHTGRLVEWLDRFLSANKLDLVYYTGLTLVGLGLTLKWGLWLGLLVSGAAVSLVVLYRLAQQHAPSTSTPPAKRS